MRRLSIGEEKKDEEEEEEERWKKPQDENIMACPIPWGGHKKQHCYPTGKFREKSGILDFEVVWKVVTL